MKHFAFTICLLFIWQLTTAQVKRQYEDGKQNDRTVVVKEDGSNDYDILESQFNDVAVGKVIRITMEKPPKPKPEKKSRVIVKKPKVEKEKIEVVEKPAPVEKKITVKRTRSVSSVSSSSSGKKKKRSRYSKRKKQKRKRYSSRKKYSCYSF